MSKSPDPWSAKRSRFWRPFAVAAAVVLGISAQPAIATAAEPGASATVSPQLVTELSTKGTTSFMVYLRERGDLSKAATKTGSDARATEVFQQLTGTAQRSQQGLRAELDERKSPYTAYWIANALRVEGDKALVDEIAARPEVERIDHVRSYKLIKPQPAPAVAKAGTNAAEWGLTNIEAPRVWSEFGVRGEGIVVANIDSGVDYEHPALVGKYRGNLGNGTFDHNYNWFDPAGICSSDAPCDNNDHGTHTMGTMVGDDGAANQIGVAPGAKWIAAKGCESNSCSDSSLLASGQWVLAPTDLNGQNPRPDLHADIVNNSWGGGGGDLWYEQTIAAWRAAGMFPSFSNGNNGPACGTAGSPGDNPNAYGVGAYDVNNNIASFSSRGASSVDGAIKPNISAPGVSVRSSVPGGGYSAFNGTSMAAPHVSGTVALIWSAAPSLRGDIAATETLLDDTATDVNALTCGGTVDDNNVFGEGRLNAYQAVNTAPRGAVGQITGAVTNSAGGAAIVGATVTVDNRSATTGADGRYRLTVPAGEHEVVASAYGFATQTVTVTVAEGSAVSQNFALVASPTVTVTGKVTDGSGHGWPLYAKIEVAGRPGAPVYTNPVTGKYSFTVPGNSTYKLTTTANIPGYQTVTSDLVVGAAAKTLNVAVPIDAGCTAPGYQASLSDPLLSETFDGTGTPAGWSVVNRTEGGGWGFQDIGNRGNLTGGTGGFANIDSDKLGSGKTQDTDLVTPALDFTGVNAPLLRFNSDYRALSSPADIDVTVDGGATWTNVWNQTASRRGPVVEEVALTPAAGAASAQVRFRYKGSYAWWWQVDNVQVVNRLCSTVAGGLVTGFTTDKNTGAALNGVTVTSGDAPTEKGTSVATPDDPNIADGFYWLFSSQVGAHPFTATKAPYQALTKSVTVVANGTKKADFALKAGRLTVTPTSVESHQPYGSTRTTKVTIKNTGSAPTDVEMLERTGQFGPLFTRKGAPLVEHTVKGISKTQHGTAYGAAGNVAQAAPLADESWTRVADLPAAVFDNAAVTVDGKVYSIGGGSGSGNEKKIWVYDPDANTWSALPDMPSARAKPSAAAVNGKIYVLGGWASGGTPVATVDVFDPAAGTWSTLSGVTNPSPTSAAGTAVAGGKIYLTGGCLDGNCTDSDKLVVFDPAAGSFSTGANYPHPVSWIACGGIGENVYCAGGTGATEYTDGYVYSPAANEWTALPVMPAELWGSQYAAAGGLLVLAGGVTDGSTAVSNRTMAYDPAAGAWRDLPNAQFSRYRGAAACGAYKIGGSPSSFVGSKETELLGGLEQCDDAGGADVAWLSTNPTSFTMAPGASKTVTVTLTATAENGVLQPGAYTAELGIRSDSPYQTPSVAVKMNVQPPATWGKIQGTVVGKTCAGATVGVKATVRLNSGANGYTLTADAQGRYAYWVPKGKYEVIVAKDGWIPEVQRVQLDAGFVSTVDFTLEPVSPCGNRVGGI
ncbi:S8 family serine peptidase [Micromonospora polyrhachis]|uniref:Subtilisin family serine protease n=1 Tax=Micromonospora polyrhachis TaxID=1282883 RepID=A0A7W7SRW0_9ACTN|nr:S8 family serine peptidase [Micromonospora polyrhachis]MBB4959661.1 subtilisin family serine protease [Micromonospora polyrhachis]